MGNMPLIPSLVPRLFLVSHTIPCFELYNPGYWSLQNIQKNRSMEPESLACCVLYIYTLLSLNFEEKLIAPAVDITSSK